MSTCQRCPNCNEIDAVRWGETTVDADVGVVEMEYRCYDCDVSFRVDYERAAVVQL